MISILQTILKACMILNIQNICNNYWSLFVLRSYYGINQRRIGVKNYLPTIRNLNLVYHKKTIMGKRESIIIRISIIRT